MPSSIVYVCPTPGVTVDFGGTLVPSCPASGTWTEITYAEQVEPFDPAVWITSPEGQQSFGQAFAGGFTLVAVAFLLGWGVRSLLSLMR